MMQTATFAKRRHNAESIRDIHPEAILIDNINGCESLKTSLRQFDKKTFILIIKEKMKNFPFNRRKEHLFDS